MFESRIKGKRLLGVGMVLALLVAIGIWQVSVRTGQAQSVGSFNGLKIVVTSATATKLTSQLTDVAGKAAGTAFFTEGPAFTIGSRGSDGCSFAGADNVGTVRIWGVSTGGGGLAANVNIDLAGFNGTLAGQGTIFNIVVDALHPGVPTNPSDACHPFGDDLIAITGGTANFRGANGEASVIRQTDGSIVIRLQEARRH
jgi:hypothetical protein